MLELGKILVFLGIAGLVTGLAFIALGRSGFRGLPGDISYKSHHAQFYFPIVSCILLSILLTLAMWLWRWFSGR